MNLICTILKIISNIIYLMLPQQQAKIQQTIALLQEVLGNTTISAQNPAQTQPQTVNNQAQGNSSEFENQLKAFEAKGK
jgi:hypothetical protein